MNQRLRPVAFIVQPQFMVDDGEFLTPLPVQPLTVPAAEWHNVVDLVNHFVEQVREQVEGSVSDMVVDEPRAAAIHANGNHGRGAVAQI
jgi:hypothetical protein